MRPISILPVLSKVFERLVHQQVVSCINSHDLLKDNISGFRKGNSTTTVLLRIRDDIFEAMKREEVTLKSIRHHQIQNCPEEAQLSWVFKIFP